MNPEIPSTFTHDTPTRNFPCDPAESTTEPLIELRGIGIRFASSDPADASSWRRLGRREQPKPGEQMRSKMIGVKPAMRTTTSWDRILDMLTEHRSRPAVADVLRHRRLFPEPAHRPRTT